MTLQEERNISKAIKQIKHNCGDEAQTWIGNIWYAFKKVEKHWELLECQTYTDKELDRWDNPWKYDLRYTTELGK